MNRLTPLLTLVVVSLSLVTCHRLVPEPDPLLDGKPRIKSITFPGIPSQYVVIDQKKMQIAITAPARLPTDITPTITLSDSAKLALSSGQWLYWFRDYPLKCKDNSSCIKFSIAHIKDPYGTGTQAYPLTTYSIDILPGGPLMPQQANPPQVEYPLNNTIRLPNEIYISMFYLYGNPLPLKAKFVHQATGESFTAEYKDGVASPLFQRAWENKLLVRTSYFPNLLPGDYSLEVTIAEGNVFRQPIRFSKGPFFIDYGLLHLYQTRREEYLTFEGHSLFEGDFTLSLRDTSDRIIPLTDIKYDRYGHQVQVRIPSSIPYNHYVLQLIYRGAGTPQSECQLLHLQDRAFYEGEIWNLGEDPYGCSIKGPVYVQRNRGLYFRVNSFQGYARLKLVPVDDPTKEYFAQATLFNMAAVTPGLGYSAPSAFIPSSVPVGRYKAYLQRLDLQDQTKVIGEGPAFWRDIVVQ